MEDSTTATFPTTNDNNNDASSASTTTTTTTSSFPLWAIIVIVVAGTAAVVGALVYGCIFLQRWRWARRHRRTVFIDGREVSVYHASSVSSSSLSLTNPRSVSGVGDRVQGGGVVGDDQSSLFFDDVEFWRAGGGWGSSVGGGGGGAGGYEVDHHYYYEDGDGRGDSEGGGGGSRRGRRLRKKKKRQRSGRSRSSGAEGFGGGTSSIMSELSVGDIAMMEAGIRREMSSSTKEGGSGSRRRRDRSSSNNNNNDNNNSSRRDGRKKSLPLPPTLPEVWRMSSGLLSVVSFASLSNLYNSLSSNNVAGQGHGDPSKEHHVVHERTMGGGGGSQRPHHRRRTSNAWVDEDAIHGPAVHVGAKSGKGKGKSILASPGGSRKGSWRRSFRESWPLRTMISPTLPKLSSPWGSPFGSPLFGSPKPGGGGATGGMMSESSTMRSTSGTLDSHYHHHHHHHHGGGDYHHDSAAAFRFPNQPTLAPPRHGDDCRCCSDVIDYSPPRQLPKPPRQALLAANAESAGDSPLGNGYYRGSNWTGARTMPNLSLSRSGSGASTDRALSYYKYEEMDYPVMLTNPQYHPAFAGVGNGNDNSGGGDGALGIAITTPMESMVPAALRLSSADSTLSGILRDTEKRLQDGTVTGVMARRNQRISMSPSKRTLGASASGPLRPTSASLYSSGTGGGNEHIATLMITTAGGVHPAPPPAPPSPAPSPTKQPSHRASGHVRQDSQASIISEADSLFAEPSPMLDHYHALTSPVKNGGVGLSPSGPPPQQPVPPLPLARHNSFNGSMSSSGSSLPTIYSVDENADGDGDDTRITAFGSSTQDGLNKLAGFVTSKESSNTLDDPFVVVGAAASPTRMTSSPTRPVTSGRQSIGVQPSSARSVPDFSQGPRLYGGLTTRSEASLRSDSPLGAISGNSSRSADPRTRRSEPPPRSESRIPRTQTPQSQRNVILLAAPTSAFSTVDREHRHQKRDAMLETKSDDAGYGDMDHSLTIPNIFLTTPSEKSDSPLPKRMDELRAQASSPTLGRGREQTPEFAPPSPALSRQNSQLSSVYDYYVDMPSNDHGALSSYRRAAGEVRKMSGTSSSCYSADQRDFERDKKKALDELNRLIRSEHMEGKSSRPVSMPTMDTTMGMTTSSVRMVPPEWLSNHMLVNRESNQSQSSSPSLPQYVTQSQVRTQNQEQPRPQDRGQNRKQPSLIPVSSTVAQLRRMNSQVSSYSNAASGYSDGSSASPFLPALMEGAPIVSPPRSRRDSARNYLALGSPPRIVPGATRDEGVVDSSKSDSGVNDKENNKHEASCSRPVSGPVSYASKIPRLDVKIERGTMLERKAPETPKKKRQARHEKAGGGYASGSGSGGGGASRASDDSLGLYDMDGFWISSSPERKSGFRM